VSSNRSCADLVLGTAQLGLRYGIANTLGQPDYLTAKAIVSEVWRRGVRLFDTAQAYGTSEEMLGRAFVDLELSSEACVISKLPLNISTTCSKELLGSLECSLKRLHIPHLWGAMLHREELLDAWDVVAGAFTQAKRAGLVERVGVSVYSAARALEALDKEELDIIQVPANVFDRRMERAGVFARARERGKTVFIRSAYLQGLALVSPELAPARIPFAGEAVCAFQRFCEAQGLSRQQFAISYVRHLAPEAKLIIGAETAAQARENCSLFEACSLDPALHAEWTARWPEDIELLVSPHRWL
jgi:aryl-alcohol dehydrogenase-like predicted oxidoreductase